MVPNRDSHATADSTKIGDSHDIRDLRAGFVVADSTNDWDSRDRIPTTDFDSRATADSITIWNSRRIMDWHDGYPPG